MRKLPFAILDTTVFDSLYSLRLLDQLKFLYREVRLPMEVEEEFFKRGESMPEKTDRFQFLTSFLIENDSWFFKCNEYGDDLVELYRTSGLHQGEAGALAQNQYLDATHELLIDDQSAKKMAKNKAFVAHGLLFVLASLHVRFAACDYEQSVKYLRAEKQFWLSDKIVHQVFDEVKKANS